MRITVHYFAAARELSGCDQDELELPQSGAPAAALVEALAARHQRLAPFLARMRLAINGDFAAEGAMLADGDEVMLMPPVAGGSGAVDTRADGAEPLVAIRDVALSVDEAVAAVSHPGAGGIATFVGVVRDHADGKPVARLDYEAYTELAIKEMRRIATQIQTEIPGSRVAVIHRVGTLVVGEAAVIIAASSGHRAEAFAACRAAIDRIKETVPIWKKEWAPDGSANWVNLEDEAGRAPRGR